MVHIAVNMTIRGGCNRVYGLRVEVEKSNRPTILLPARKYLSQNLAIYLINQEMGLDTS